MLKMLFLAAKAAVVPSENGSLPTDSLLPPEAPPGDYGMMFMKMFLTLMGLVALMGLTVWVLRRFISQKLHRKNGGQAIQILEKRMISQKTMLYLVEVDSQRVLIAESHLEVRRLHALDEKSPPLEQIDK